MIAALLLSLGLLQSGADLDEAYTAILASRTTEQLIDDYLGTSPIHQELARRSLFRDPGASRGALRRRLEQASSTERALLFPLLCVFAEEQDLWRFEEAATSISPTVRGAAAEALSRLAPISPVLSGLLEDPIPEVVRGVLDGIRRHGIPRRTQFAAAHFEALAKLFAGPEPRLRRASLEALLLHDGAEAARLILRETSEAPPAMQHELLDHWVRRVPAWPLAEFSAWIDHIECEDCRLRCQCVRVLHRRRMGLPAPTRRLDTPTLLAGVLDGSSTERDAALTLLALDGAQRGAEVVDGLAPNAEHFAFSELVTLVMQLRGPRALDDLVAVFLQLQHQPARISLLGQLHRLRAPRTSRALLDRILPASPDPLLPAVVECARLLPDEPVRRRVLHRCLERLDAEERVRAFEELVRTAPEDELDALIAHLRDTFDAVALQHMAQVLAQAYGPSDPQKVLGLLAELMDSPRLSDRVGALAAVPFVALGSARDSTAEILVRRFREEAPDRLAIVLAHLGGPVAEAGLADLLASSAPNAVRLRPFFLEQAGAFSGEPTRRALLAAVQSNSEREREEAYRALIERNDPAVVELGVEVLLSLRSGDRAALLRELQSSRHLAGMGRLITELLPRLEEDDARAAVWELGAERHSATVLDSVIAALDSDRTSVDLRDAALQALGRMPEEAAGERLDALLSPLVDASLQDLIALDEDAWILARAAALARKHRDPTSRARDLAAVLIRGRVRSSFWDLRDWVQEDRSPPAVGDAPVMTELGRLPPEVAIEALETALRSVAPLDVSIPESFFLGGADRIREAGASEELASWFESQPLLRWPVRSRLDLSALVRAMRREHPWLGGDFARLEPRDLRQLPSLLAVQADHPLRPREKATLYHPADAFRGWDPERTLDAASWLEHDARVHGAFGAEGLANAAREAGHHGILLAGLAELALEVDGALALELAETALEAAPHLPYVLGVVAWVCHLQGRPPECDRRREHAQEVLESGLTADHPTRAIYEAAILLDRNLGAEADAILGTVLRNRPELAPWIRGSPSLQRLAARLEGR